MYAHLGLKWNLRLSLNFLYLPHNHFKNLVKMEKNIRLSTDTEVD